MHPEVREALERTLDGKDLTRDQAVTVSTCPPSDLPAVQAVSGSVRDGYIGRKMSYSRKLFLPLTNLCRDYCGYCTFRKNPGQAGAKTMTPQEVVVFAKAGEQAGCKEALFLLGDRPEARLAEARETLRLFGHTTTLEYLRDMCELVLKTSSLLPHSNPGVMTKRELTELRDVNISMGLMLENVSERLCDVGGPHEFAMSKRPKVRLATIEAAGELKIPFTTGLLIGIGETPEERVDSLFAIRDLHRRHSHIQEIIIQNFRAKPETPMAANPEPSTLDMLRTIAVARLIFRGETSIQAPPNLAPEAFGSFISAGINDWGGVSPVTKDFVNPEAPWPEIKHLRKVTANYGFELKERLAVYPEYLINKTEFIPRNLLERAWQVLGSDGYVKGGLTS